MFIFDIETLSKKTEAVILSMAAIHVNVEAKPSPQEMRDGAFVAKFNVVDQIKRLNRKSNKSTIDWWNKQCDNAKIASFKPSPDDVIFEDGYEAMRAWAKSKNDDKAWVFARGNLDQLVLDDIEEQCGLEPIWYFNRWRDVRTAVDLLYDTSDGYCGVNYPGFDPFLHITKHIPLDDCVLDAMMMLYGVVGKQQ